LASAVGVFAFPPGAVAATNNIFTVAGIGGQAFSGDGGPATAAQLDVPVAVAATSDGGFLIADAGGQRVRRVSPAGTITTVAGTGTVGFSGDGGAATAAELDDPIGVAATTDGGFLIADEGNSRVRRVSPAGTITTIAGTGTAGFSGDGSPATAARLNSPNGVAASADGGFLIADTSNARVRRVSPAGTITTVAGRGTAAFFGDGGPATSAHLFMPSDVQIAKNGDLYIVDMQHNRVRKVDARTHVITTIAGNGMFGLSGDDGPAIEASLANPAGVALVEDSLGRVTVFIADYYNGSIRWVGPDGVIRTVSHEGVKFSAPTRVAFAPGSEWLYVADASNSFVVAMNIPSTVMNARAAPRTVPGPRPPIRKIG
jgi:DNA-binding beta-propeller fold protein YncE